MRITDVDDIYVNDYVSWAADVAASGELVAEDKLPDDRWLDEVESVADFHRLISLFLYQGSVYIAVVETLHEGKVARQFYMLDKLQFRKLDNIFSRIYQQLHDVPELIKQVIDDIKVDLDKCPEEVRIFHEQVSNCLEASIC